MLLTRKVKMICFPQMLVHIDQNRFKIQTVFPETLQVAETHRPLCDLKKMGR